MTLALTLPLWTLKVVLAGALALIWLAVLLCLADWIGGVLSRRNERRLLDRLWEDEELLDEYRDAGFLIRRPPAASDPRPDPRTHPEYWTE